MKSNHPSMMTVLTMKAGGNQTVAPMIIPPDGGWGWVIVMTGFISSTIIDGISYCFFLYRDPMMKDLQIEPGDVSFLSALFTGFYFLGGILACSAGNHFGFRPIMLLGAIVVVCCLASGYVLNDITFYYVIVGIIGGMAAGFIFVSGALPVGFYFDKKRSIAVGLVGSGSGVGAAVVPQATNLFMNRFGWRETFLFHASLCAVLALLGLLIRPLRPVMVVIRHADGESRMSMWTLRDAGSTPIDMSLFQLHLDSESVGPNSIAVGRSVLASQLQACPTIEQLAHDIDVRNWRMRKIDTACNLCGLHHESAVTRQVSRMRRGLPVAARSRSRRSPTRRQPQRAMSLGELPNGCSVHAAASDESVGVGESSMQMAQLKQQVLDYIVDDKPIKRRSRARR